MKTPIFTIFYVLLLVSGVFSCKSVPQEFILYEKGVITPIIVIPNKAKGLESKAAELFAAEFKIITGSNIKIILEKEYQVGDKKPAVFIGNTNVSFKAKARYDGNYDGFLIGQKDNQVYITCKESLGLLNAVTSFFEIYCHTIYLDAKEKKSVKADIIKILGDELTNYTPAFAYRQAYFPQSLDYDYAMWNKLHLLEEKWAIWGHNLHKLINLETLSTAQKNAIYALVNGKRYQEQYCFSNIEMFSILSNRIESYKISHPDATYYSITPNDNLLVCSCPECLAANHGNNSSTNSVALLINKLARQFPDLVFTSLAYQKTINAPATIKYEPNVIIMLSTIDYPKGQPLSQSKDASKFKNWVSSWKKACNQIYIWDYTIQYTNYFDFFPNLSALQQDLIYFKELGVTGVLEQGSEDQYCLFDEMRSYVIAKLLWNPNLDVEKLRYDYIEHAYTTHVDFITDFLTIIEKNLSANHKTLNIYGSIYESIHSYMSVEEFDLFFYEFSEKLNGLTGTEKTRMIKVLTGMIYNKLEIARTSGVSAYGYADYTPQGILKIHPEINILLNKLNSYAKESNITVYNEVGNPIEEYIKNWTQYIIERKKTNVLINKPITLLTQPDEYNGNAKNALNDACYGFPDFEVNWLLFNNTHLEVEIPATAIQQSKNISLSFLNDPRHYIFLPTRVELYIVNSQGVETKLSSQEIPSNTTNTKQIFQVSLSLQTIAAADKLIIKAINPLILPESLAGSNRKPSIACDEIEVY